MYANFKSEGSFSPEGLLLGPARSRKVIIASGAGVLTRGTVLGKITTGGKYVKSASASSDGSQVVDAILADDKVDATSEDVEAIVYISGVFDQSKLILGTGHTLGSIDATLRDKSIWLESSVA